MSGELKPIRVIRREAMFIKSSDLTQKVKDKLHEKLTFSFFQKEKVCQDCEWFHERLNDICQSCANYKGSYELAAKIKIKDTKYLKLPVGSWKTIRTFLEKHVEIKVKSKHPDVPIKKFKFKGELRDGQEEAIAAMLKYKRGILQAPPRSGKCIVGSSLIMTEEGLGPIKDLFADYDLNGETETVIPVESEVATVKGIRQIANLYSKVVDTTIKISTESGYTVRGTENHKVLIAKPGFRHAWVRLDSVKPGDFVVVSRKPQWLGIGKDLLPYDTKPRFTYEHQFKLPSALTTKLARLLGYWVANGSLSIVNRVGFFTENNEVMTDFISCLTSVFPDVEYKRAVKEGRTPGVIINKSAFKRFLAGACDLSMSKAAGKYIPKVLMQGDKRYLLEFLSAYISCDSWVHRNGIQLCSASNRLARELHAVLGYLGIVGKFRQSSGAATNGSGIVRSYYNVNLHNTQARLLLNLITLRKENKLEVTSVNQHDTLPYVKETLKALSDKYSAPGYSANGPWLKEGVRYGRTGARTLVVNYGKGLVKLGPVNRNFLGKVNKKTLSWLDADLAQKFENYCSPDLAYQEVTNVKTIAKPVRVYDIEVPEGHHFVANSIVNHNTVMGTVLVSRVGQKTLILASQRDWLMGFRETFVGSDTQPALTNLDPSRIKLCKTLKDFQDTDICLATVQTFYSPGGEKLLRKIRDFFGVVLVDECFPAGTMVTTDKGPRPIEAIVENFKDVKVLSYNHDMSKWEFKQVTNGFKKKTPKKLLRIKTELGEFTCTEDHEIFSVAHGKYVRAKDLVLGDELLSGLEESNHSGPAHP